jgi:hypothetical protein
MNSIEEDSNLLTAFCKRVQLGSEFGDIEIDKESAKELLEAIHCLEQEYDVSKETFFMITWAASLNTVSERVQEETDEDRQQREVGSESRDKVGEIKSIERKESDQSEVDMSFR